MAKDKKHKKDKKKRKHSSSDDSSDSEDERARRAEKKAKKLAKKLKEKGEIAGYTNADNPFGDANLTERFVWGKKLEKQIKEGADVKDLDWKAEKQKQIDRMTEIEKVKKRRDDREREKAQMEEEMEQMQRERAYAEGIELEKKEEEFHVKQAQVRSEIRLREGRGKPVDVLARNLQLEDDFDPTISDPVQIFRDLTLSDLEDLRGDIQSHLELDGDVNGAVNDDTHKAFWRALMVVCNSELEEQRRMVEVDRAHMRGEEVPAYLLKKDLQADVDTDVQEMLKGKSAGELQELYDGIAEQIASGEGEVEYWEAVLQRISVAKARSRLSEIHRGLMDSWETGMRKKVERGEPIPGGEGGAEGEEGAEGEWGDAALARDAKAGGAKGKARGQEEEEEEEPASPEPYDPSMSPEPVRVSEREMREAVDIDDDMAALARARQETMDRAGAEFQAAAAAMAMEPSENNAAYDAMLSNAQDRGGGAVASMYQHIAAPAASLQAAEDSQADSAFRQQAAKAMGGTADGDAQFTGEVDLGSQAYWWHDKYRPRKPKYFNRVHTGYEWNKYNQTHYDHDNPPPKVVQGYKFNIFYPDLIDRSKAPTYSVERDDSKGETVTLRISAGPPYEDIAFKVVNREWEYSHKKGFKCTFERGILHLYINFKRHRYRR